MPKNNYPQEFKQEAASLVLDQNYTLRHACNSQSHHQRASGDSNAKRKNKTAAKGERNLKKGFSTLDVRGVQRMNLIDTLSADYPQSELLHSFDISRSTYHYAIKWPSNPLI